MTTDALGRVEIYVMCDTVLAPEMGPNLQSPVSGHHAISLDQILKVGAYNLIFKISNSTKKCKKYYGVKVLYLPVGNTGLTILSPVIVKSDFSPYNYTIPFVLYIRTLKIHNFC